MFRARPLAALAVTSLALAVLAGCSSANNDPVTTGGSTAGTTSTTGHDMTGMNPGQTMPPTTHDMTGMNPGQTMPPTTHDMTGMQPGDTMAPGK